MAWVKIDDKYDQHPKVLNAGPLALAMQVAALCYANRNLTDGFLPTRAAAALLPTVCFDPETGEPVTWRDVASSLVEAGIWDEVKGGYEIHDYLEYQKSAAEITAAHLSEEGRRQWEAIRNWAADEVYRRDGRVCTRCGAVNDLTIGHIVALANGGTNELSNLQVLCRPCNSSKGAR